MLRQPNHRHRSTSGISILQINTQRSSRVHAAALQLACADDIEIICVQEPWVNRNAEEEAETQKTQTHPRYDIFSPLGTWTTRPRTMIYIRKDLEASQKLLKDEEHPDICMITLRTNHGPLDVINIYNAGPGSERTNEAVERIMEYQTLGEGLICGDFNLHHGHWDPNATRDDAIADRLVDWLLDRSVALLTDPQVPTRGEAVLDLTMATNKLYRRTRVEAYVDERYACGSDHEPILTCI
ncbi:Endonuclease/exonuclease/phosphatase, partial [Elaphomyces granulatus]